ncbi:single-stranded DNA-binding protein [Vibrio mimicus]|uniref:single-stranded DNA-binding protein n=1 Tax=Vibrio mimicus TaxID=674 RepID=UPI001651CCC4|nr:single-stranded DNA-binding protein [Vibrio mimicus]
MLKIEVFKDNKRVETRAIKGKEDKTSRVIYEQTAYVYLGGKFPVEMKIGLDEGCYHIQSGLYSEQL